MNSVSFGFGVASSCESSLGATDLAAPADAEPGAFDAVLEKSCALAPAASDEGDTANADTDEDPTQAAYAAMIAASTLASADVAPAPLPPPAPAALLGTGSGVASNAEKNGASLGVATSFRESATSGVTHAAGATIGGDHDASSSASPGPSSDAPAHAKALDARVAKASDAAAQTSGPDAESAMKAEAGASVRAKPAIEAGGAVGASGSTGISIAGFTPVTPTPANGLASAPMATVTSASSDADAGAQASAAAAAMSSQVSHTAAFKSAVQDTRAANASSTSVDRASRPGAATSTSQAARPARARIASVNASPSARLADAMDEAAEAKAAATGEGMQGGLGHAHATAFASASATEGRGADVAAAGALTPNDDRLTNVNASTSNAGGEMGSAHRAGREHAIETASRAADRHAISRGVHAEIELGDAGRVQVHASRPDDRIHVRLDADAAATARALGEHARDLARELQTSSQDARVTVSGPTTHASVTSDGSARGDRGMAGGNGSSQERDERTARSTNDDGTHARSTSKTHTPGARARFVL